MDQPGSFHKDELFQLAKEGLLAEAGYLADLAQTPHFRALLETLEDYAEFLLSGRRTYFGDAFFKRLNGGTTLDFNETAEAIQKLRNCLNLLAACDLFAGWSLPFDQLQRNRLEALTEQAVREIGRSNTHVGGLLAQKLNSGDATRVIQLLKILGCIAPDMTHCSQISVGASGGTRDRSSIHQIPVMRYQRSNLLLRTPQPELISFKMDKQSVSDIVLVDNDPKMEGRYQKLSMEKNVLALNLDAIQAMEELRRQIDLKDTAPRNFVVAFRIDHRMIPDAIEFLKHLGLIISDTADLVITIGAGHSNAEFKGRLQKIEELNELLHTHHLQPLKIKWHRGNTPSEQRQNPIFGDPTYATYEILYCKLIRSRLPA